MTKKDLIILIITIVIVGTVWLVGNSKNQPVNVSSKLQQVMRPVNPNFDQETLNKINTLATNSFTPAPIPSGLLPLTSAPSATSPKTPTFTSLPSPSPSKAASASASSAL